MEIDWSVIMDIAVVVAIIGVIGILIKAVISNKSMKSDLSNEHALGRVSEKGEHDALGKDIGNVSNDTNSIKEMMLVSKTEEKLRMEALSKDQLDIKSHLEGINNIQRVVEEVNKQNETLKKEVIKLNQEIKNLKQQTIKPKMKIEEIGIEDEEEYER